ncbi:MAG: pore-forming ESAT-6 family protein [Ornithinimicrobium sp.]
MGTAERISYDTHVSGAVQAEVTSIISRVESLIVQRDAQVAAAMADFRADGVSDEYYDVERRWRSASAEVAAIITLVREVLQRNDETAMAAASRARAAVMNIG